MLCLKQHETTKTTFVLFDGQHTGINHVNYQNIPALVLPNEVDVSFHLSELENGPHEQAAIERPILAVDNTGRYLIVFDQLTGQEHSVNLETGAIEGRRRPLCWTKTFTLRCRSNPGEPWSEVLRLGADTDEP